MTCPKNSLFNHSILLQGENPQSHCPLCYDPIDSITESPGETTNEGSSRVAQLIAHPSSMLATLVKKSVGNGKEVRNANIRAATASTLQTRTSVPGKSTQTYLIAKPTPSISFPPSQTTLKLLLKVAHRSFCFISNEDVGQFTNFMKRSVFTWPQKSNKEYEAYGLVQAIRAYCKTSWPGGAYHRLYRAVFIETYDTYIDIDNMDFANTWALYTGHLDEDDNEGANLVRLPTWPIDSEDHRLLPLQEIINRASFTEERQRPQISKSKSKEVSINEYKLTLVYEFMVTERNASPELGTLGTPSTQPPSTNPPRRLPTPLPNASTAHKRGISNATPQEERAAEETIERSRSGRILRATTKAIGQ